jgi:hypothetical protein
MQRERALSEKLMVVASLREGVLAAPGVTGLSQLHVACSLQ